MNEFRILFWNTYRKPLTEALARLVESTRANVVAVAEWGGTDVELVDCVSATRQFKLVGATTGSLRLMATSDGLTVKTCLESTRWTIHRLVCREGPEILLGVVHLPSKFNAGSAD